MACKYSGMQFVSKLALDYVASKTDAPPAKDVWPLGGPKDAPPPPPQAANFTFGEKALEGRYDKK